MNWTIESGIPIPPKRSGHIGTETGLAQAVRNLEVSQSIHVENLNRSSVCGTTTSVARTWGGRFVTRATPTGIRIWRVE